MRVVLMAVLFAGGMAWAEGVPAYTNHAGIVVCGVPILLEAEYVTLSNETETVRCPLSIFPVRERRRLGADAGSVRFVPRPIRDAVLGNEKAVSRSKRRAEKKLCTKEESEATCAASATALKRYLDREEKAGRLLPAERALLDGVGNSTLRRGVER